MPKLRADPPPNSRAPVTVRAVHASEGVHAWYAAELDDAIAGMQAEVTREVLVAYGQTRPQEYAHDAPPKNPSLLLRNAMRRASNRWISRFDKLSLELGKKFASKSFGVTQTQLKAAFKDAGFTVKFQPTPASAAAYQAVVAEQVNLIKSIPQQYLKDVESKVWQSVMKGSDMHSLSVDLRKTYGVTRERAALIARDQNAKAKAIIERTRRQELGITHAIWQHSAGGKVPRVTHVAMSGKQYLIGQGMYDSDEGKYVLPGELINCFPGSAKLEFAYGVRKAYRRWYCGELTEIITETGKTVSATVNHPILTSRGWIAIGQLNEGDYVFEVPEQRFPIRKFEFDVNHAISDFSQVFAAFEQKRLARFSTISASADFHGDGRPDSNVDIVFPTRFLTVGRKPRGLNVIQQFSFADPDNSTFAVCAFNQFVRSALNTAYGIMGRARQSLTTLRPFLSHAYQICRASPANLTAGKFYSGRDRVPRNPVFFGQRKNANSGLVFGAQLARVIRINHKSFQGHVYNLETRNGWYVADGIIAHNCRCTSRAVIPGFESTEAAARRSPQNTPQLRAAAARAR